MKQYTKNCCEYFTHKFRLYQAQWRKTMRDLHTVLEITFRLTYGDGCVYAKIDHLLWDGDYHDDWFTTSLALSTIYGN